MYKTIERPGYAGFRRNRIIKDLDKQYGADNWRIAWQWGDLVIAQNIAVQLYEDAYYEFFKSNPDDLAWLVRTASDVYDISPRDVDSGLDYSVQDANAIHLQDIAIRRTVLRMGKRFEGNHLVQIRGKDSEGAKYNPGFVPFHVPDMIVKPSLAGWWQEDSIEDFYQSNKLLQVRND